MAQPKTTRHKGITRIDRPAKRTHGYQVRIFWQGCRHQRFFADRSFGDRLAALAAAIAWRDATERDLGKPRSERQVVSQVRTASGHLGIRTRSDTQTIEATWVEHTADGLQRQRRTSFSIRRHGSRRALNLALKARRQGERARQLAGRG